jgi:hypothetical protein
MIKRFLLLTALIGVVALVIAMAAVSAGPTPRVANACSGKRRSTRLPP